MEETEKWIEKIEELVANTGRPETAAGVTSFPC
jgi:hypothetical protein